MPLHKRSTTLRREFTAADRIPYATHVAPTVVRTSFGDYLQVLRLGGAAFESSDDEQLNNWHERLNVLWRNIAGANVALWTQVIRRRARIFRDGCGGGARRLTFGSFADDLKARYGSRLANETLMVNEIYLAVVFRPTQGAATGLVSKVMARSRREGSLLDVADALDACEKLSQTL